MSTKLTRLYKNKLRLADVNVVDENDGLETDHELSLPEEYPAGEGDSGQSTKPGLSGPGNNLPRIEGAHNDRSAILALVPPKSARDEIAAAMGDDLHEDPDELHITLVYIGKNLSEETCSKIEACLDSICSDHEPLNCKMQGLGVFDHEDDGGRPFYSSIDAVGMAKLRTELVEALEDSGVDIEHKYDFTPHMTLGYIDPDLIDVTAGSPGVEWESDTIVFMNGDKHVDFKLGSHSKEAGGFGFDLLELSTPSKGDGFLQKDTPLSENTQEDPDLKLGDVEEPYSTGDGPINTRFDDELTPGKEYNITKGAAPAPLFPKDFTPEEEEVAREEVGYWPSETKVLNDFMLERGHEPMI